VAASAGLSLAGLFALAAPVGAAQAKADPKGNNGTIKIDRAPFDSHPDNEPHVGCRFDVDFYGFDKGDNYAQVTFTVEPPTGKGEELLTDSVFIGEDSHSGGGSEPGLDAHAEYVLTKELARFPQQPQQGWHVKLTVHADGAQGADTKHKVFWVKGCGPESKPPVSQTPPGTPPGTPDTPKPPTPGMHIDNLPPTPAKPDVAVKPFNETAAPAQPAPPAGTQTQVLGAVLTRTDGQLPHTGAETLPLAGFGLTLLGTGQAVRAATRRRTH
jgi:hypothetical protein